MYEINLYKTCTVKKREITFENNKNKQMNKYKLYTKLIK